MTRRPAVLLGAGALVLAGCGGAPKPRPTPTPRPAPPSARALIQRALDARAAHVRAPGLGVRDVHLRLESTRIAGGRARVTARLSYRVRGVPGAFTGERRLRAVERGGRWHVAGGVQAARERAPWEADRYERRSSGHFVVWVPRGIEPTGLPEALADGYRRLRATLRGGTLRRRYLVVVARDPGHARRMTASIRGLRGLTALTDTEVRVAGPAERVTGVASQRLLVLWPAFSALDPETQRQTVTHELTHAALAPVTSGRVPGWLAEGVAMYVAGDSRAIEPGGPSLASLSAPDAIARRAGVSQGRAYALASAAAFHIAARYGSAKLLALYEAFGRPSLRGRAGDPALADRALRRVLGIGLRRLQRDLG